MELPLLQNNEAVQKIIGEKAKKISTKSCEKILLVHPMHITEDIFYLDRAVAGRYWSYPPSGCGILCRDLEMRGYITDLIDLNFEILSAAHSLKNNFYYGIWEEKLLAKLVEFSPDLVGISCMFSMSHSSIKKIARKIKEHDPSRIIVIGGVHASNASKLVLEDCRDIDFLGTKEGDRSFPDFIDFINGKLPEQSISQLSTLIDEKYFVSETSSTPKEEIESSPLYHSLPIGEYNELGQIGSYGFLRKGRKSAPVLSNRGCRAHCSFCSVPDFNGIGVRQRSIKSVLDEIQELYDKYGIRHITWLDDDLLYNRERAVSLFNGMVQRNLDLTWDASNGLIVAAITPEIMQAMSESGCIGFNLGIESGSPEILRSVHKPGTVESFRKGKVIMAKYPHIFVKGFIIVGFPNETLGQIKETIDLCVELCFDWYSIQILNLLPSTEIYKELLGKGIIEDRIQTSDIAYVFGPSGRQRQRELNEKNIAKDFINPFLKYGPKTVHDPNDLTDHAFLMDYWMNYHKVVEMTETVKIKKAQAILEDICLRIAPESPLAHLFLGIAEKKLENISEASTQAKIVRSIVDESAYWQKRFMILEIYKILEQLEL